MAGVVLVTGASGFVGGRLVERLVREGWQVRALARSEAAARSVSARGAVPIRASLDDEPALVAAARGCEAVLHAAALFRLWGDPAAFERTNVEGTRRLLRAAAAAEVPRVVQVGAAAVVMGDMMPILRANETMPLRERSWAPYAASKARSEALVLAANRPGAFETVVVRPPMVWGAGMPTLDVIAERVRAARFVWPGDGSQAMSTAHVDNVCHAVELARVRGRGGEAYFVSDGADGTLRQVISDLLSTRRVLPPTRSAPLAAAWRMAAILEWLWRTLGRAGEPPITRQMLRLIGQPFTLDITKAEQELGYRPIVSWSEGLQAMRA